MHHHHHHACVFMRRVVTNMAFCYITMKSHGQRKTFVVSILVELRSLHCCGFRLIAYTSQLIVIIFVLVVPYLLDRKPRLINIFSSSFVRLTIEGGFFQWNYNRELVLLRVFLGGEMVTGS